MAKITRDDEVPTGITPARQPAGDAMEVDITGTKPGKRKKTKVAEDMSAVVNALAGTSQEALDVLRTLSATQLEILVETGLTAGHTQLTSESAVRQEKALTAIRKDLRRFVTLGESWGGGGGRTGGGTASTTAGDPGKRPRSSQIFQRGFSGVEDAVFSVVTALDTLREDLTSRQDEQHTWELRQKERELKEASRRRDDQEERDRQSTSRAYDMQTMLQDIRDLNSRMADRADGMIQTAELRDRLKDITDPGKRAAEIEKYFVQKDFDKKVQERQDAEQINTVQAGLTPLAMLTRVTGFDDLVGGSKGIAKAFGGMFAGASGGIGKAIFDKTKDMDTRSPTEKLYQNTLRDTQANIKARNTEAKFVKAGEYTKEGGIFAGASLINAEEQALLSGNLSLMQGNGVRATQLQHDALSGFKREGLAPGGFNPTSVAGWDENFGGTPLAVSAGALIPGGPTPALGGTPGGPLAIDFTPVGQSVLSAFLGFDAKPNPSENDMKSQGIFGQGFLYLADVIREGMGATPTTAVAPVQSAEGGAGAPGGGMLGGLGKGLASLGKGLGKGLGAVGKGLGDMFKFLFEGLGKGLNALSNPKLFIGVGVLAALGLTLAGTVWAFQQLSDGSVDPMSILLVSGALGALGGVATLIGKQGPQALMGAGVIGAVGASLAIASLGLSMLKGVDWTTITAVSVSLGALGGIAVALGMAGPAGLIGAGVLGAVGAGLGLAGAGLGQLKGVSPEAVGATAISLGALGGVAVALGLAGPVGYIGAGVLGAVGLAMIPFAHGLSLIGPMAQHMPALAQGLADLVPASLALAPVLPVLAGIGLALVPFGLSLALIAPTIQQVSQADLGQWLTNLATSVSQLAPVAPMLPTVLGPIAEFIASVGGSAVLLTVGGAGLDNLSKLMKTFNTVRGKNLQEASAGIREITDALSYFRSQNNVMTALGDGLSNIITGIFGGDMADKFQKLADIGPALYQAGAGLRAFGEAAEKLKSLDAQSIAGKLDQFVSLAQPVLSRFTEKDAGTIRDIARLSFGNPVMLAKGGVVQANPGVGVPAIIGETKYDEMVIPLNRSQDNPISNEIRELAKEMKALANTVRTLVSSQSTKKAEPAPVIQQNNQNIGGYSTNMLLTRPAY